MNKKAIINPYIIGLLIISLFGIYLFANGGKLTVFEDDYLILDDFTSSENFNECEQVNSKVNNADPTGIKLRFFQVDGFLLGNNNFIGKNVQCRGDRWVAKAVNGNGRGDGEISTKDGFLEIKAGGSSGRAEITSLEPLFEKDIKINARVELEGERPVSASITYGGATLYEKTYNNRREYTEDILITINPLILQEKLAVSVNGKESLIDNGDGKIRFNVQGEKNSNAIIKVFNVKYRYLFNCEVENDEVVVYDEFTAGTQFRISDLSFDPLKFCPESYPAVIRSFDAQGVRADIFGEVTRNLARGNVITVPNGQSISLYYIADFKEGKNLRCPLGSAYSTKDKKCIQIIVEQEDLLELGADVNDKEKGELRVNFVNAAQIGSDDISSAKPTFSCEDRGFAFSAPQPDNSCWETTVSYKDEGVKLKWGETKNLGSYFKVGYFGTARWEHENDVSSIKSYDNIIILDILNRDYLTIIPEKWEPFVKLNDAKKISFSIDNKLSTFKDNQAGLRVIKTTDLIQNQKSELINIAISSGKNVYSIDGATDMIGQLTYQITPYIIISGQKIYDDQTLVVSYYVYDEEKPDIPVKDIKEKIITEQQESITSSSTIKSWWSKFWDWIMSLF